MTKTFFPPLVVMVVIFLNACSSWPKGVVSRASLISKKGVMQECTFYQNGKLVAKILYDETGQQTKVEGSIPDGPVKHLFTNGAVNMEINYLNNMKHGTYKIYTPEGKQVAEGSFKQDKLDGLNKSYDEQGILTMERTFQAGVLHGPSRWLYPDGSVMVEKNYQLGQEHGKFVWKDKKGKITATEEYKNGVKIK